MLMDQIELVTEKQMSMIIMFLAETTERMKFLITEWERLWEGQILFGEKRKLMSSVLEVLHMRY